MAPVPIADHERLVDGGIRPDIGAEVFVEQAVRGADAELSLAERIPCQTNARCEIIFIGCDQTWRDAGVAREYHS